MQWNTSSSSHGAGPRDVAYRAHRRDRSPWWYASDADGRFNLPVPNGTCYLTENSASVIREVVGEALVELGYVTVDFAASRIVSTLAIPGAHECAEDPAPQSFASAAADSGIAVLHPPHTATIIDPPTA